MTFVLDNLLRNLHVSFLFLLNFTMLERYFLQSNALKHAYIILNVSMFDVP